MRAVWVSAWMGKLLLWLKRETEDHGPLEIWLCPVKDSSMTPILLAPLADGLVYRLEAGTAGTDLGELAQDGDWFLGYGSPRAPVPLEPAARLGFLLHTPRIFLKDGRILFPLGGEGGRLTFRIRARQPFDGAGFWWKERISYVWFLMRKVLPGKRQDLVIYEKYCSRAEDNGFAFFCFCMQNLDEQRRKHVYFILDRDSTPYDELRQKYGRQIVPFLSFRHLNLMLNAWAYAASESRSHGFAWKAAPGPVLHELRKGNHPILFLQHGVTALKKVDGIFGIRGTDPMTWFAVTSGFEQQIIARHFGYPADRIPILGFPRWDFMHCGISKRPRYFLYMPTWRTWLEDCSPRAFLSSDYYHAIRDFLWSSSLLDVLIRTGTRLMVYLHPKFASLSSRFSLPEEAEGLVEIPDPESFALSGRIEECSALVTDYSSVSWDAYYLGKPVLFYQFDRERYLKETGSYLDLGKDLFGPAYLNKDDLIQGIRECADRNFTLFPGQVEARERYFPFQDDQNCRRVLDFLEEKGWPHSIKS